MCVVDATSRKRSVEPASERQVRRCAVRSLFEPCHGRPGRRGAIAQEFDQMTSVTKSLGPETMQSICKHCVQSIYHYMGLT
jgi:hypothetical protein